MTTRFFDRQDARRTARIAQVSAAALVLASVAVGVVSFRPPDIAVDQPPLEIPAPPAPAPTDDDRPGGSDARAIADRLSLVMNHPVPGSTDPEDDTPLDEPLPATPTAVAYLGSIAEPGRRIALMKIGERQRLLGPGQWVEVDSLGKLTIVDVLPETVVVEDSAGRREITKSARSAGSTTVVNSPAIAPPPTPDPASEPDARRNRGGRGQGFENLALPEGTPDAVRERILRRMRDNRSRGSGQPGGQ